MIKNVIRNFICFLILGCGLVMEVVDNKLEVNGNFKLEGDSFLIIIVVIVLVSVLVLVVLVIFVVLYYKMKCLVR